MLNRILLVGIGSGLAFAAAFFTVRHSVIKQTPKTVMTRIEARIAELAGGTNICRHNRNYGPRAGSVARANPDSIVTSMAYDLSAGPVYLAGAVWPRYWSLSVYQHNTDNIFVINDRQLETDEFQIVIARQGQSVPELPDRMVVRSPSMTGIVLIRRFVPRPEEMPGVRGNQDAMVCGPLGTIQGGEDRDG